MKAIVYTKYGPPEVLQPIEIDKPSPKSNEVLIQIHATTVTAGDVRMRKADPFVIRFINGLFRPRRRKILGMELAGKIEAIGKDVTRFNIGDLIYGSTGMHLGAYAEYLCLPETGGLLIKPDNISFGEAAALPVGSNTALYYLRNKGKIEKGQKVLIYGASGSVGTYAIQLAKNIGANVTGVCSTNNLDLVKSLNADTVLDYTIENFIDCGEMYDLIFDAVGKLSYSVCKKTLSSKGKFVTVNKGIARGNVENFKFLRGLVGNGKLKIKIDRFYPLKDIADAHKYVEKGHKKGNVVITVAPPFDHI